jgi:putative hydrolase of the HAD superfamily
MPAIRMVGFDADDTLWHSETHFQEAHAEFERIVGAYVDLADAGVHERLLATERENIRLFGYGAKGMTLSMIETAIALSGERISAADLHRIVALGKALLQHPVELLPGVREAVAAVAATHRVVLITKGDLFHQERKVAASGLSDLFQRIEIVSEKDETSYARLLREFEVAADAFAMVGNSLKSDIAPVLALGGWGIHVPYPLVWALERAEVDPAHPRFARVDAVDGVPAVLAGWAQAGSGA